MRIMADQFPYLTTVGAAKRLNVTRQRVWQLIQDNELPGSKQMEDDRWVIPIEAVENYKNTQRERKNSNG